MENRHTARQHQLKQGHKRTQSNSEFDFDALKSRSHEQHNSATNSKSSNMKFFTSQKKNNNLTERIMQYSEKEQLKVPNFIKDNCKFIIIEEMDPDMEAKEDDYLFFGKKVNQKEIRQFEMIDEQDELNQTPSISEHTLSKHKHVKTKSQDFQNFAKFNQENAKMQQTFREGAQQQKPVTNVQNYIQNYVKNYNQCYNVRASNAPKSQDSRKNFILVPKDRFKEMDQKIHALKEQNTNYHQQNKKISEKIQHLEIHYQKLLGTLTTKLKESQEQSQSQFENLYKRLGEIYQFLGKSDSKQKFYDSDTSNQSSAYDLNDTFRKKKLKLKFNIMSQIKTQKNSYLS